VETVEDPELTRRIEAAVTVAARGRGEGGRLHPSTRKRHARAWSDGSAWLRAQYPSAANNPWSSETLALYAVDLLERGYAKSTVDGRLSAIKAGHRQRGLPVPDGVAAWFVLRGANDTARSRAKVNSPRPRRGALADIAAELDARENQGARDLCLATLGWDVHAKVSELVRMDIGDVMEQPDGVGLRVQVGGRWLKVLHTHEPVDVCPVEPTLAWLGCLRAAGARSGPLFRAVDKGGNIAGCGPHAGPPSGVEDRLHESAVRRIWARLVARSGLPRTSTPHDLRMGSALDAARNGVPLADIIARGGWSPSNGEILVKLMRAAEEASE
jgi:integrase